MEIQSKNATIQDFLKELVQPTSELGAHLKSNTHQTADIREILAFGDKAWGINERLNEMFAGDGGTRSKIIERFFINWNNAILGVSYVSDKIHETNSITEKHYEILKASLDGIQSSLADFGITP